MGADSDPWTALEKMNAQNIIARVNGGKRDFLVFTLLMMASLFVFLQ